MSRRVRISVRGARSRYQHEDQSPIYAVSRLQGIEDPSRLINPVIHPRDSLLAVIAGPGPLTAGLLRFGDGRTHRVDLTAQQLGEKPCLLALTRLDRTRPTLGRDRIRVCAFLDAHHVALNREDRAAR
jgi:hypothetical protein